MEIHIKNEKGGIIQQTDKPIINNFVRTADEAIAITQSVMGAGTAVDYGRLPLFVADKARLVELARDLAVCESTTDVCRAVQKLNNGRIPLEYKGRDFVKAVLPLLRFQTTESAIYQALNKIL